MTETRDARKNVPAKVGPSSDWHPSLGPQPCHSVQHRACPRTYRNTGTAQLGRQAAHVARTKALLQDVELLLTGDVGLVEAENGWLVWIYVRDAAMIHMSCAQWFLQDRQGALAVATGGSVNMPPRSFLSNKGPVHGHSHVFLAGVYETINTCLVVCKICPATLPQGLLDKVSMFCSRGPNADVEFVLRFNQIWSL